MTSTAQENVITLRGSTDLITEFFEYSVNNILYQRGIYPPESFQRQPKYGLSMVQTLDEELRTFISNIISQLHVWLLGGKVQKLILVIIGVDSGETLERWAFDCECSSSNENVNLSQASKSQKEIMNEIQAIMRQITASVTFLPLLNEACKFDLLVYADKAATVPVTWEDSSPMIIKNAEEVQLRSFSTKVSTQT